MCADEALLILSVKFPLRSQSISSILSKRITVLLISLIVIGATILFINIPQEDLKGFETESYWYVCQADVPLCQMERANNCSSYKMICAKCCEEWGLV